MTDRTFYIDIGEGLTVTSLVEIRRVAIDHLWTHPEMASITVWTSSRMRTLVGTVRKNRKDSPLFQWVTPKGCPKTLYRNGSVYKNLE